MESTKKEWFAEWFDSPYYHILYKNRNFEEAEFFINNLINFLQPKSNAKMLDLACGAGRHSLFLNKKGYEVTGVDLSANSIELANKKSNESLDFAVHDMREVYKNNAFDYIFSMFTSFGYFDDSSDNLKMLQSVKESLKEGGVFVLDFLNSVEVINHLVSKEEKEEKGVQFDIKKKIEDGFIIKDIYFETDKAYHYQEKVQAFTFEELKQLFAEAGLTITNVFGSYSLAPYEKETSKRLILIAQN